jgi:DNA polymerase-3 subunit alpha
MHNSTFTHLHVHNEFSILDGMGKAKILAKAAKQMGFKALGLTNHGNVDGCIKFQKACKAEEIIPILGTEAYIVPDATIKTKGEKRGHITILAKNLDGWQALCRMMSYASTTGHYYRPRLDFDAILEEEEYLEDLVIMSGCVSTFIRLKGGLAFLEDLTEYCDNIYLEVMPHLIPLKTGSDLQKDVNQEILDLSEELDLPLVATNDNHYIEENDCEAQEVLLAIQQRKKWKDPTRFKFSLKGLHLRSADEMFELFKEQGVLSRKQIIQAMRNTNKIVRACKGFEIPKQDISLPPVPGIIDDEKAMESIIRDGWERVTQGEQKHFMYYDANQERLEEELSLIKKKGFIRYFLIVWELINWCRKNNIMVGPGRGSVGGSLVAYLMGITQVDPIKHGLLFSRFIAKHRNDYPDIDIDFEDRKRHEVIEHLENIYGKNNVAGISAFSSMKARAAVRDVARVFEVPYDVVDMFVASLDDKQKNKAEEYKIRPALETWQGEEYSDLYPEAAEFSAQLENQVRHITQHAAAVVVSDKDLRHGDKCVLTKRGKDNSLVINWDMEDAEYSGLMKLDILGLNTLTVLSEAKRLIENKLGQNGKPPLFNWDEVPFDEPKVYEMIAEGETVGIFQLSGLATRNICQEIEVSCFDDIVAAVALSRPGPSDSGMASEFIKRKTSGKKWEKKHRLYEEVTKDTYGIIVYQEQVMAVINKVAGLDYSTADKIRKIIGKKRDPKEFESYWQTFLTGCKHKETMTKKEAEEFWEMLQAHASYSFNKSHSVAYATLAYWTAWCKNFHPTEFFCAYLSHGNFNEKSNDTNRHKGAMILEAKAAGLTVMPPKIGISQTLSWEAKEDKLFAPFTEVKGIGESMARQCIGETNINIKGGFFNSKQLAEFKSKGKGQHIKKGTKLHSILQDIKAFESDGIPGKDIQEKYFDFTLGGEGSKGLAHYFRPEDATDKNIRKLQKLRPLNVDIIKSVIGNFDIPFGTDEYINKIYKCSACNLIAECSNPVLPSIGSNNVAILGEAPARQENKKGEPFIGDAGDILWDELGEYDFDRDEFYITNICKCWPSKSKTPKTNHIQACHWWRKELKLFGINLVLALGNVPLQAITGRKSGIMNMCGNTEWNNDLGLWIAYCIHPSAVSRDSGKYKLFEEGIANFVETYNYLVDL